jgi:hypothetical protein
LYEAIADFSEPREVPAIGRIDFSVRLLHPQDHLFDLALLENITWRKCAS